MEKTPTNELIFFVNGRKVQVTSPDPDWTLLFFLRNKLRLTGTKLVCGEGGCGACTVMVSKYSQSKKKVFHLSVNACLMPLCAAHGLAITTVEGIGSSKTRLHPVQERMAKSHGSQCGFCTPGIVMSMYTLLRNKPLPSMQDVETFMQGNLCRCTGYRPILDGLKTLTSEFKGCGLKNCCQLNERNTCGAAVNGTPGNGPYKEEDRIGTDLFDVHDLAPYDPTQEAIFPPELMLAPEWTTQPLRFIGPRVTWYRPATLEELLRLKASHPDAKLVNGNTEVGLEVKFKHCEYPTIIDPSQIEELTSVSWDEAGVTFGAATTLSDIDQELRAAVKRHSESKTRVFSAMTEMLRWFAGTQIRNVSAIGGNIMTGSPISDLVPLLMSADSQLTLMASSGETRTVPIRGFYTGYRENLALPQEILVSVTVPFTAQNEFFMGYKQAHRRDDDIAIVNAGIFVRMRGETIETLRATYGGMAATAVSATKTEKTLVGRKWDEALLNDAVDLLLEDLPLDASAPGGMVEYRRTLATSFFFKFFLQTTAWLTGKVDEDSASVLETLHRPAPKSSQLFQVVPENQPVHDLVGRPVAHVSALKQATGEAQYCDDIAPLEDELHAGLVLSSRAHARIVAVDETEALQEPGVTHFFSAKDLEPDSNKTGPLPVMDEEVFRAETVTSMGQLIGIVLARDRSTAQRAARKVKITYEELPAIITIEDAVQNNSFYSEEAVYEFGDVDAAIAASPRLVEGSVRMGGQEHFYLEPAACIAIPKEDNEMEMHATTQSLSGAQELIARALGIPANRVVCKAKRLGGGFGGKETRMFWLTTAVAVAANRSGHPVRAVLERDEDMVSMGTRHPFLGRYRAGVTAEGKLKGVEIQLFSNGGYSNDLSFAVMSRATVACDNAYMFPAYRVHGKVCRTNTPSNTAFRGFGAPQSCFVTENMMEDIATQLGLDPVQVRRLNMCRDGDPTIIRQEMRQVTVERCMDECMQRFDYRQAKEQVETFNRSNRWKKRGLAAIPSKFPIAFDLDWLNKGGALVHIYLDGSVLVTIGGVEMGQGLFTKCYQIVTRILGVPTERVYISETSTDKVPNTTSTAASMSTDLYGAAVKAACEELWRRLTPFREASPKASFTDWVNAANLKRVNLSACGFEATRHLTYDPKTKTGNVFAYFVFGASCSLVEIDCLTGDHQVLRTDIVMDIGESLNPAIDIGQIEGAFMQGYGLFCMERLKYSPKGFNYTRGPGAYKVPGFGDIPLQLNVSLLRGSPNPRAVYSSKAVGEPPLFAGASVFFAIKEAIRASRAQHGLSGPFNLDSPATPDRIRMACQDKFTQKLPPSPAPGTFVPWMVDL